MLSAGEERPYGLYAMSLAMVGSIAAMTWDKHLVEIKKERSQRSAPAEFSSNGSAAHTVLSLGDEAASGSNIIDTSFPPPRYDDSNLPISEAQPAGDGDSSPIDAVSPTGEPTDQVDDPSQSDNAVVEGANRDPASDDSGANREPASDEHSTAEFSVTDQTLPAPRFETSDLHQA